MAVVFLQCSWSIFLALGLKTLVIFQFCCNLFGICLYTSLSLSLSLYGCHLERTWLSVLVLSVILLYSKQLDNIWATQQLKQLMDLKSHEKFMVRKQIINQLVFKRFFVSLAFLSQNGCQHEFQIRKCKFSLYFSLLLFLQCTLLITFYSIANIVIEQFHVGSVYQGFSNNVLTKQNKHNLK